MNRLTRPEVIIDGVTHRPGCDAPGWISKPSRLAGWHILRCAMCGACRLVRGTS